MGVKHTTVVTGTNDAGKQVSVDVWNETHTIDSDLLLPSLTVPPATPAAGLRLYARLRASRELLEFVGPSGVESALQPAIFGNRIALWNPGSGTALGSLGMTPTTAATLSHPTPATTTIAESLYRTRFATSATAGNAAGVRDAVNTVWRGNAAGRGGFFSHTRVASGAIALAGAQVMCGFASPTTALGGEPSALADCLGLIKDSGDANWQLARRTGTGTVQKINTGEAYTTNKLYDLTMYARPNWDRVSVRLLRHEYDGTTTTLYEAEWTDFLPAAATLLGRHCQVRNGTTASAAQVDLVRSYLESDL